MSLLSARDLWVAPSAEGPQGRAAPGTERDAVVRGFSLELDGGEWVAVSGANGCGKTSLLLSLAGLWPVRSGALRLDGRPFGPRSPRELRSRVAVILQDPSCQLVQPTVLDELAFSALNLGCSRDEVVRSVAEWSEKLGLTGELARDPQHLSAGKQQLLLLAAALIARPVLLLADEPAAHLDQATRRQVLGIVREEVGRGLAAVWVTQDPEEKGAADRVLDLTRGHIPEPRPVVPDPGRGGEPLLTLGVSPWDGTDGPHVSVTAPLEIPVARTGVTAVEGPNAAGKSVLLAAAVGLVQIDQVRVVNGPDFGPPPLLAAQYPELEIFEEYVRDEVVYAAVSRGIARAEAIRGAARLFDRLGLEGERLLGRRTWGLSGGEKRLVSLVGALVAPGGLLVLDEPTVGLDPGRRAALARVIAETASSRAVLIASQDREWVTGLAVRRFTLGELGADRRASGGGKTD